MNTIKINFSPKFKPEFINELRDSVNEYFELNKISKYGNANLIIKSILMCLLYFGPLIIILSGILSSPIAIFISWVVMGFGMAGVGMVLMHDANHKSYSRNATLNYWLSKSLYFLGGYPANWRHQHNKMHHGFTNIDGHDEDIDPGSVLRLSPHKPLLKLHKYQHIYAWVLYGLMTLTWVTTKDFVQLRRYKKTKVHLSNSKTYRQLAIDLFISKVLYYFVFLVLPLLLLPIAWYFIVLCFLMMHFVSGFILTVIFQTAHVVTNAAYPLPDEKGNIDNNWAIHQLSTTMDFAPKSKIFSWAIGGLNYQIEHHLFPNISHVHYKNISKFVKSSTEKYGLPYYVKQTFFAAVYEHYKMLKLLGRSKSISV
jgi:linoleoyl-CoA desaturase